MEAWWEDKEGEEDACVVVVEAVGDSKEVPCICC